MPQEQEYVRVVTKCQKRVANIRLNMTVPRPVIVTSATSTQAKPAHFPETAANVMECLHLALPLAQVVWLRLQLEHLLVRLAPM
jgi:hypothetical protein